MKTTLAVAISQIGVEEATGKNDGVPAQRYMDGDELPWCAGFVLWCNRQSVDPKIGTLKDRWSLRAVHALEKWCLDAGIWLGPRIRPAANDLVFYADRGASDGGAGRHVGIVESAAPKRSILAIEGNVGNAVRRVTIPTAWIDSGWISGFARIDAIRQMS